MAPQHDIHLTWPFPVPSGNAYVAGTWSVPGHGPWEKLPMRRIPDTDLYEITLDVQEVEDIDDYLDDDGFLHHELLDHHHSHDLPAHDHLSTPPATPQSSRRKLLARFFGRSRSSSSAAERPRDLHLDLPFHHQSKDGIILPLMREYRYQFKFVIDDEWRCDPHRHSVPDQEGNWNHEIVVDLIEQIHAPPSPSTNRSRSSSLQSQHTKPPASDDAYEAVLIFDEKDDLSDDEGRLRRRRREQDEEVALIEVGVQPVESDDSNKDDHTQEVEIVDVDAMVVIKEEEEIAAPQQEQDKQPQQEYAAPLVVDVVDQDEHNPPATCAIADIDNEPTETILAPAETAPVPTEIASHTAEIVSDASEIVSTPEEIVSALEETVSVPEDIVSAIDETTSVPEDIVLAPEETTSAPAEIVAALEETLPIPVEVALDREETESAPAEIVAALEETLPAPTDIVFDHEEIAQAPAETASAPTEAEQTLEEIVQAPMAPAQPFILQAAADPEQERGTVPAPLLRSNSSSTRAPRVPLEVVTDINIAAIFSQVPSPPLTPSNLSDDGSETTVEGEHDHHEGDENDEKKRFDVSVLLTPRSDVTLFTRLTTPGETVDFAKDELTTQIDLVEQEEEEEEEEEEAVEFSTPPVQTTPQETIKEKLTIPVENVEKEEKEEVEFSTLAVQSTSQETKVQQTESLLWSICKTTAVVSAAVVVLGLGIGRKPKN
ncbi:hypothetical protein BGZ98_003967 [Dissophora globulifera]|nr:hypothetical protein BGZ98_003967 [Dissophora globulifera]